MNRLFGILITLSVISSCTTKMDTEKMNTPTTDDHKVWQQFLDCPSSPNCKSSFSKEESNKINPLTLYHPREESLSIFEKILSNMDGELVSKSAFHLHFTFKSKVFKFIDDFYLYLPQNETQAYIKSASRTGYSDLGVNKKRVNNFIFKYQQNDF